MDSVGTYEIFREPRILFQQRRKFSQRKKKREFLLILLGPLVCLAESQFALYIGRWGYRVQQRELLHLTCMCEQDYRAHAAATHAVIYSCMYTKTNMLIASRKLFEMFSRCCRWIIDYQLNQTLFMFRSARARWPIITYCMYMWRWGTSVIVRVAGWKVTDTPRCSCTSMQVFSAFRVLAQHLKTVLQRQSVLLCL